MEEIGVFIIGMAIFLGSAIIIIKFFSKTTGYNVNYRGNNIASPDDLDVIKLSDIKDNTKRIFNKEYDLKRTFEENLQKELKPIDQKILEFTSELAKSKAELGFYSSEEIKKRNEQRYLIVLEELYKQRAQIIAKFDVEAKR